MKNISLVYNRKNNVNGYAIAQVGTGMSFAGKIESLKLHDPLFRSHNWRKMHGLPIKTPRLNKIDVAKAYSTRSKKKAVKSLTKHALFNPLNVDIENPRIKTAVKRYRYEPKKLRRKIKRILLSEQKRAN